MELFRRQRIVVLVLVAAFAVTGIAAVSGVRATLQARARMLTALDLHRHLIAFRVWLNRASVEALGATIAPGLGNETQMAEDHERTRSELGSIREHVAGDAALTAQVDELGALVERRIAAERDATAEARQSGTDGARALLAGTGWGLERQRVREVTSTLLAESDRLVEREEDAYDGSVVRLRVAIGAAVVLLVATLVYLVVQLRAVRRARAEALAASELARRGLADLEGVLDTVPAAVLIARDPGCQEVRGNRAAEIFLRAAPGQELSLSAPPGRRLEGIRYRQGDVEIAPADLPLQVAARTGNPVEGRQLDAVFDDGTIRHLLASAHPILGPDGTPAGAVAAFADVTETIRVSHELLAALAENRTLLAASRRDALLHRAMAHNFPNGAIGLYDHDLRFLIFDGARFALPVPAEERVGRTLAELLPPDVVARIEPAHRAALRGEPGRVDLQLNGRTLEIRTSPVRDERGEVILAIATSRDVTDELSLRTQLSVSSRLASLGTLVAGVAHEINNPLAGALGSLAAAMVETRSLATQVREGQPIEREGLARSLDEVIEILLDAQVGGQRIARIVKDLALFGRPNPMRARTRLGDVVTAAMRWLPASVGEHATVHVDDLGAPDVHASSGQLEQVVVNLVTNAAFAIPEGRRGDVWIRVATTPSGRALLEVADDGQGIEPADLERIFDPFFTTRAVGRGMGLGLPICHAIVAAHDGSLTATSTPGRGSVFRVELPAADARPAASAPPGRV